MVVSLISRFTKIVSPKSVSLGAMVLAGVTQIQQQL